MISNVVLRCFAMATGLAVVITGAYICRLALCSAERIMLKDSRFLRNTCIGTSMVAGIAVVAGILIVVLAFAGW